MAVLDDAAITNKISIASHTRISIVVPIFNLDKLLPRCIESIINQHYKNLEIILVNDGSTDESGNICDMYASKDERIVVVHQKNGGVSNARNTGLRVASGEWVSFIDADDSIEADMYSELINSAQVYGSQIVICGFIVHAKNDTIKTEVWNAKVASNKTDVAEAVIGQRSFSKGVCNKLFSSKITNNIRFCEDLKCGEDMLFLIEALLKTKENVSYVPKALYHIHARQGSASATYHPNRQCAIKAHKAVENMVTPISRKLKSEARASLVGCSIGGLVLPSKNADEYYRMAINYIRSYIHFYLISKHVPLVRKFIGVVVFCFPRVCFQIGRALRLIRMKW